MSSSRNTSTRIGDPFDAQLPEGGGAPIYTWLVVGVVAIMAFVVVWEKRSRDEIRAEAARLEDELRQDFKKSQRQLRDNRPREVLDRDPVIGKKVEWLVALDNRGYGRLRSARYFMRAAALGQLDTLQDWLRAEEDYDRGLNELGLAGGRGWEFGMYGRGRARYHVGRLEDAVSDFSDVIKANPSFGAAY